MRPRLVMLAAYLTAAAVFTWPLVTHPASLLGSPVGPGDPFLNLWILGWDLQSISTHPGWLLDGRIFDATIFHPSRQALAYSDHSVLQALLLWPIYALTQNAVLCYNLLLLGSLVAAACAMNAFAHAVTGSRWGAFIAGLVWGFWPYHFTHLIHVNLQSIYFLPLAFLFLHRLIAGRRIRDAIALGIAAGLQGISSVYYGVIMALALTTTAIVLVVAVGRWRSALMARRLVLAGVVGVTLILPVVWVYGQVQRREGFGRTLYEAARHAATPASYVSVPPMNLLYGATGLLGQQPGDERELFPGFAVMALAAIGAWMARRRDSAPLGAAMVAVIGLGFVLSLGPDGLRAIYASFHRYVFGFHAIRAPARFGVLVAFGLAGLAALGVREIVERLRERGGRGSIVVPAALALMVSLEYANAPIPYVAAPPPRTALGQWLRHAPEPGPVVYLPMTFGAQNTPYMLNALEHRRPIVNGYSGNRPGTYNIVADTVGQFPSADAFWTLHELGVRFIVSPHPFDGASWPIVERARFGAVREAFLPAMIVYELRWTREAETRFAAPPPPDPGPIPFQPGEVAVYTVAWAGAGSNLPAGEATLSVHESDPRGAIASSARGPEASSARFRFVAAASTAEWISRFFEARDTFETLADAKLLPLVHSRHLREGRRTVDLLVNYDHAAQVARRSGGTGGDRPEIALRIPPGVRDTVTAFYYARTLPLDPASRVRLPINDAGENMTLEIHAIGPEEIEHGGQRVSAQRIEPRIIHEGDRRPEMRIVLWLSADARRIPLRVEISAGFGAVRAELTSYRSR